MNLNEQDEIANEVTCRMAEGLIRKLPKEWIQELIERLGLCTHCYDLDHTGCRCWDDE